MGDWDLTDVEDLEALRVEQDKVLTRLNDDKPSTPNAIVAWEADVLSCYDLIAAVEAEQDRRAG